MMTANLLKYYLVFPKIIFPDFAVFYSTEDMAIELKLEIENILGLTIKFEAIPETQILQYISQGMPKEDIAH